MDRDAATEGKVVVEVVISVTGKVIELGKVTGPEVFHQAAKQAARQWEFSPAQLNAEPVRDGTVLLGYVDLVHVDDDRLTVIDFKTDPDPDPEKYRSQLENYQRVLGHLIGLREESILTKLLFTRPKKIVEF